MRITKIKTKNFIILFFALILTLAVFSQLKAFSSKPTSDVGFDGQGWFYSKSDKGISAFLGKKDSNVPTARYQKDNHFLEFSMNQVSSTTDVSLETNTKEPNTPTLFYRNVAEDIDANYKITNLPFRVKEEIILGSLSSLSSYKVESGENNLTFLFDANTNAIPVKQPDGSIYFYDSQNNYRCQIDKPFMVDNKGIVSNEVSVEIKPTKTKTTPEGMVFGGSNLERNRGLPPDTDKFNGIKNIVKLLGGVDVNNAKVLDLGGIEPPESVVAPRDPRQARPRTKLFYHKETLNPKPTSDVGLYTLTLSANSGWLNDPARVYPVTIDPTITHDESAEFNGQYNRIANASTTAVQLESSYPEATKDPYTVLLLHFNEANGATSGIKDYASTTRVITANDNASTTSYVTQLGLGNSAAFDGTGDYLSAPDSDDWTFGSGDFSIDFWVKFNSISGQLPFLSQRVDGTQQWFLYKETSDNKLKMVFINSGDVEVARYNMANNWNVETGQWYHLAFVRKGPSGYIYIDGISQSLSVSTSFSTNNLGNISAALTISGASWGYTNGYFDSLRILKGRALTSEEIKAAASRRPSAVYTSPVLDASASVQWDTLNWTEGGVNTGDGEQPYNTNSLVTQWNFNDTSDATITASSSGSCTTACNGTLTNFAYTASQDQATTTTGWTANNKRWGAGALMMESAASADYVSVTDPASNVLDPNSADLTIETWIKTSDTSAEIFSNNNANGTACTNNGYYLGIDASGYPVFYLDTNGATAGCDASTTSQFKINDGNWHNIAVSVTRGTSAVIYVDGKTANSDTSVTSYSAITVTGNVYFGGSAGGLDAIVDSTRFYSRALSAAEILSNYQAGNIEIQTRTGDTSDPNDGSWEAWKPTTGETQLLSMDSDAANWHSDIMASTTIATSTELTLKMEGTGSLKLEMGKASSTVNTGTVALWHFEETGTTTGTYLYDETANNNDATTTGTTVVDGIFGKARKFNGTSDYVTMLALTGGTAVTSVDFWVYPQTTTEYFVDLNGSAYVWSNAGTVTATGFTSPTIYVNGAVSSAIVAGQWQHVAITTETGINASAPNIGKTPTNNYLEGNIDEIKISNRVLSPDEIAETYRMGANHHLTRQVSAADLSPATKIPFYIAGDRPGTYLEAMIGESDYANYELASSTLALSTTTVLYIKGDEIAPSTSIKDSSFSGKTITANGNARTAGGGKIGNAMSFDGTSDYFELADNDDWDFTAGNAKGSIDFWFYANDLLNSRLVGQNNSGADGNWSIYINSSDNDGDLGLSIAGGAVLGSATGIIKIGKWYHVAGVKDGSTTTIYLNSAPLASGTGTYWNNATTFLRIGGRAVAEGDFNGLLDELRIIKGTALTADQIRQAYEYGLRSHPITIDFGATLQTSDLISSATDYNFSLTATTSGLSATTSGLYLGDKIIIKENLGGTEYAAQGTVNAINASTGAITVPSWDSGSTFPSGNGYSPTATVFKWQREYFDITGAATTTRNAITNFTIRPTNGAGGRTIYLDDFRYNTNYLTASSSSAITKRRWR